MVIVGFSILHLIKNYSNPKSVAGSDRPQSLAQQQTNSESDFGLL
jgi:hypothetical protein